MSKLYCVGELLIDFQAVGISPLKDTAEFVKKAGGAPANVCVQATKLGKESAYLTKVGADDFGSFLIDTLKAEGVDVSYISQSKDYDTSLAFVSFLEGGEREFSFYRRTAADLYINETDFKDVKFNKGDILEYGSVALKTEVSRKTHKYLIDKAKESGALVCFDPNLRFNLWENKDELKNTVRKFATYADVIKVGVDELEFITDLCGEEAVKEICKGGLKILLLTDGAKGAKVYYKGELIAENGGYEVKAVDTTGAGDSCFGGFISELMEKGATPNSLDTIKEYLGKILDFACKCGAYTTMSHGAIAAMGNKENIEKVVK